VNDDVRLSEHAVGRLRLPDGVGVIAGSPNGARRAVGIVVARFNALVTEQLLSGALDALRLTVVPVEALYWSTSGQVVIMTLLGGAGTFFGPFVGAATYLVLADRLSIFIEFWPLVIGVIFMAFVLFLPRGIWGTLTTPGGQH